MTPAETHQHASANVNRQFGNMKKHIITAIIIAITGFFSGISAQNDFEIVKNVDIFISVLNELNEKYADEISPGELTQTAIKAMLKSLDPYTVYYNEGEIETYRSPTKLWARRVWDAS